MVAELKTQKLKNGKWRVTDKHGNSVEALTKEMAMNQYRALYQIDMKPQMLDTSQFYGGQNDLFR